MLVLSRRKNERLMIGDDVFITILEIKGSSIRIGIEAPEGVEIMRQEILDRITQESNNQGDDHDRSDDELRYAGDRQSPADESIPVAGPA